MVSNIFYFRPYLGKIPILINMFQDGLVQPPTRRCVADFFCQKVGGIFSPPPGEVPSAHRKFPDDFGKEVPC